MLWPEPPIITVQNVRSLKITCFAKDCHAVHLGENEDTKSASATSTASATGKILLGIIPFTHVVRYTKWLSLGVILAIYSE